ncbi:uncharacterized protein MELLADRAFT_71594 [Melampsora larici-populina 98AG31]|uniref:Uncharacterized protein n=1 Tax=Melampsora larici-populina (strain 98AG31 / pathotype 3-4-7) TaxID=747676 RepID=F4RI88_MELLP|nr:uncharacterized protein MELLADRAFT_71594 [Melampsora larici-populina 98AG31]EGG07963.1 hypothetical protein MELLADRAFT_71594 [Melampsora larici-populina 98AG31]
MNSVFDNQFSISQSENESQLLSTYSQPTLSNLISSITNLVIKANQDYNHQTLNSLISLQETNRSKTGLFGSSPYLNLGSSSIQDDLPSCFKFYLSISTTSPKSIISPLLNLFKSESNQIIQNPNRITRIRLSFNRELQLDSIKLDSDLISNLDHHSLSHSIPMTQTSIIKIEEIKVLHERLSSDDLDQSFISRLVVLLCLPFFSMVIKLIQFTSNYMTSFETLPYKLGQFLMKFSHRTVAQAENKANQHRIMEKEFLRVIKSELERLFIPPDASNTASFNLGLSSASFSVSPPDLYSPSRGSQDVQSHLLGTAREPSSSEPRSKAEDGFGVLSDADKSLGRAIEEPVPCFCLKNVKFGQLLHTFTICLIFQLYWTSVNMISRLELAITQYAYRFVLWINPNQRRHSASSSASHNSPRPKEISNKPFRISQSINSPLPSSIMKPTADNFQNSIPIPGRVIRNVSWDNGSILGYPGVSNNTDQEMMVGKIPHLHRKDSKVLPKSPKPILTHASKNNHPKIEKIQFGHQSSLNKMANEVLGKASDDQEEEDEDEEADDKEEDRDVEDEEEDQEEESEDELSVVINEYEYNEERSPTPSPEDSMKFPITPEITQTGQTFKDVESLDSLEKFPSRLFKESDLLIQSSKALEMMRVQENIGSSRIETGEYHS